MQSALVLGLAALAAAQTAANEPTVPVINNNVPGTKYIARLDGKGVEGITGYVELTAPENKTGTLVTVDFSHLPAQADGGPFLYHIHQAPVAANGSCLTTLAHLDPSNRGEDPPCDASKPDTCQAGDLSGKHGKITTSPDFKAMYEDDFLSTTPGTPAFFGNRSITLHFANKTRIACANFQLVDASSSSSAPASTSTAAAGGSGGAGSASPTGSSSAPQGSSSSAPITPANGATSMGWSAGAVFLAAAAFAL